MTTLIVGGSGFIGSETYRLLVKKGLAPVSFDKMPTNENNESWKYVTGDILDLPSVERMLSEYSPDTVVHLVGLPIIETCEKNPNLSFLLNVKSVHNTLEAMRLHDAKKIIFSSSATIYGTSQSAPIKEKDFPLPETVYGYHKLVAEQLIKSYAQSYGISYMILRLFNVYGANPITGKEVLSVFIRKALKGEPLVVRGPRKFRDFIHVDDVALAFLKAQETNGSNNVLNIASGTRVTLGEIAEMIREYFPEVEIVEEPAEDDGTGLQADISKARKVLGFESNPPETGIPSYISKYAQNRAPT